MNATLAEIAANARKLPPEERERLAKILFESVHHQELNEIEEAWLGVAERRADAYGKKEDPGIPADEFFDRIERNLGWK